MTDEQRKWLEDHPAYSKVGPLLAVSAIGWTGQGYLWSNGKFSEDDSKTLTTGFYTGMKGALRVGRRYQIV